MAGKPLPLELRYTIDPTTGCWNFKLVASSGYGHNIQRSTNNVVTTVPAHRFFYEQKHGPINASLDLDHLCRNRRCVNPDHLEPVTRAENIRRSRVARLTRSDVTKIRELGKDGIAQAELAARFGVNPCNISRILAGKRWSE